MPPWKNDSIASARRPGKCLPMCAQTNILRRNDLALTLERRLGTRGAFMRMIGALVILVVSAAPALALTCRTDKLGTTRCSDNTTYRTNKLGVTRDNRGNTWRTDKLGTTRSSDGTTYRTNKLGVTRDNRGNTWRTDKLGTTRGSNGITCRTDKLRTTRCN